MKIFQKIVFFFKREKAYTLLELLVVLSIIGLMMSIVIYGVIKFRQTIIVSNTAKEVMLNLRNARRNAINNVVTESGFTPTSYYVEIGGNSIKSGACDSRGTCSAKPVESVQSSGTSISTCGNAYSIIKFNHVTGDFIFANDPNQTTTASIPECRIAISMEGVVGTERYVIVSRVNRTIRIE